MHMFQELIMIFLRQKYKQPTTKNRTIYSIYLVVCVWCLLHRCMKSWKKNTESITEKYINAKKLKMLLCQLKCIIDSNAHKNISRDFSKSMLNNEFLLFVTTSSPFVKFKFFFFFFTPYFLFFRLHLLADFDQKKKKRK